MLKILILCLISFGVKAQTSYIPFSQTLNDGGTDLSFNVEYFRPVSKVTENGEGQAYTENNNITYINMDYIGRYGFTKNFEGWLGARARVIQTAFVNSDQDYAITKSGFESVGLGFKYGFDEVDRNQYSIEAYYRQAAYSNEENIGPDDINLGDDTREYGLGGSLGLRTRSMNFWEFRALYRSPADYLSNEILTEAQFSAVWDSASIYFGLENVYSLEDSPFDETIIGDQPSFFYGPGEYYNSINRSWTAPYIGMNLALGKKWRLGARYTQVYTGNSTEIGPRILFTLASRQEQKKEYVKRDSKFKEYTMEGTVVKISKSRKVAVIDIGAKDGLKKGMPVDFYYFDYVGGNKLIAKGVALRVKASKAIVKIKKRYGRRRIQQGTVARAGEIRE